MQNGSPETINLFVYGTLLRGFPKSSFLQQPYRAEFAGEGRVRGYLYDAGSFPAFVPDESGPEVVGEIYRITDPDLVLDTLDTIEGYNTTHPERSLYVRKEIPAICDGKELQVMVYVYNLPVQNLPRIEFGDYRRYVRESDDSR